MMRAALLTVAFVVAAGCGTSSRKGPPRPPVPPMEEPKAAGPVDAHLEDVKKAVSEQLECPLDQLTIQCIRRDAQDECVAVRGDGCGRTLEYQFGDVDK